MAFALSPESIVEMKVSRTAPLRRCYSPDGDDAAPPGMGVTKLLQRWNNLGDGVRDRRMM